MTNAPGTLTVRQTWASGIPLFAVCRILMITPLLLGTWADLYGLSAQQVGLVVSLELAALGVTSLTAGVWIGRVNPRAVMLFALPAIALGDAVSFYLPSADALYPVRAVLGVLAGTVAALGTALLAHSPDPTRVYGYNVGAQFGYGFLAFLIIPPLMIDYGVLPLAATFSLTTLLVTPVAAWAPSARLRSPERTASGLRVPLAPLAILIATVVFFVVQLGMWAFIERLGIRAGHGLVTVGQVIAMSSLAGAPFALFIGHLERLTGLVAAFAIAGILQIVGLILLHDAAAFPAYAGGLIMFGIGWAMVPPLAFGLLAATTTDSVITAMLPAAQTAGMAIGPAMMAMLIRPGDFSLMINTSLMLIILFLLIMLPLARRH